MEAGAFAENRDVTPVIQSWTRIWLDMMVRTALLLVIAASACGRRCPASWFGAVVCARGGLSDGPASASSLSLLRLRGGKQQPRVQVESGRTGVEEATVEHGRVKTRSRKAAHGSASCVAGNATGILSKKRENKSVGEQEKNRKPELKTIKTDGKRRHRTDPDSGGSSEERVQSKRVSAGKESEERSKGKHKKARDEKKAEKSSKMRTQKSSKMRTREKDGGERTEPQARPDTAVPKTRAAPKPEQSSLDKKPQGMALARKLMTQMGWGGDGHGLGKNSTGTCCFSDRKKLALVSLTLPDSFLLTMPRSLLAKPDMLSFSPSVFSLSLTCSVKPRVENCSECRRSPDIRGERGIDPKQELHTRWRLKRRGTHSASAPATRAREGTV